MNFDECKKKGFLKTSLTRYQPSAVCQQHPRAPDHPSSRVYLKSRTKHKTERTQKVVPDSIPSPGVLAAQYHDLCS